MKRIAVDGTPCRTSEPSGVGWRGGPRERPEWNPKLDGTLTSLRRLTPLGSPGRSVQHGDFFMRRLFPLALLFLSATANGAGPARSLPTPREMADSRTDVWGEAALRQPGGPSYELFKDLLPPLRYVNTAFRHYPIVLSAPSAPVKARWVSNGSGINPRAEKP